MDEAAPRPTQSGQIVRFEDGEWRDTRPPWDWEAERARLTEDLQTANDPRSILEHLMRIPREHSEQEPWDDYLVWVYEQADRLLALAKSGIPDVGDQVLMVLSSTYIFMDDRADGWPEYGYKEKTLKLREKILSFFKENAYAFSTEEAVGTYRLGLRLPMLARISWLSRDGGDSEIFTGLLAHYIGTEAVKKGPTPEDHKEEDAFAHSDTSSVEEAFSDLFAPEDMEEIAFTTAKRNKIELDLRKQRLPKASDGEKYLAHMKHLREWVYSVLELEAHAPDAPRVLQERFGIVNFNHFPTEALKQMYDKREEHVPYGVLVAANFDWNDALSSWTSVKALQSLYEQLSERGLHLRIIEVYTPRTLANQMVSLNNAYGEKHKISFAIVHAHGGEEEVQLGQKYGEMITKKALKRLRPGHANEFFTENPSVAFISCNVGADDGLAEAVAEMLGGVAYGPSGAASIKEIVVSGDKENLKFTVVLGENAQDEGIVVNTYDRRGGGS